MSSSPMFGNWLVTLSEALASTGAADVDAASREQMIQAWALIQTAGEFSSAEIAAGLATQAELDVADFSFREHFVTSLVPLEVARRRNVFPLRSNDTHIWIATSNPLSQEARREFRELSGRTVIFEIAPADAIAKQLDLEFGPMTEEEQSRADVERPPVHAPSGPHILVVDDEAGQRTLLRSILEEAGFRVSVAEDGRSAVELLTGESTFDLITLDYWMNTMNGLRVLQHIRAHRNPEVSDVPVIMVTGAEDRHIEMSLFEAGTDDYITKPIDAPLMTLRVRAVLRRRRYA